MRLNLMNFSRLAIFALSMGAVAHAAELRGAGASFPSLLYTKMFEQYALLTRASVAYESVGSGEGQERILGGKVDFAGSDVAMKGNPNVLHVPTALGAVVVAYNVRGLEDRLQFTGEVLADIYLGRIKRWSDSAIANLNPDVTLPDVPITVVYRKDESGTTNVFTDYLSKIDREWQVRVGSGLTVNFPVGSGVEGNAKLAQAVSAVSGAIGYTELTYAVKNKIPFGLVRNRNGKFVRASPASVTAAAVAIDLPDDNRVSLTNSPAPDGYPISSYTYALVQAEQAYAGRSEAQARALKALLRWMITDAQKMNAPLQFGALPAEASQQARRILEKLTYKGKPLN